MKAPRIFSPSFSACLAVAVHILSGLAFGQAAGEFVIPSFRTNPTTRFAYWDLFSQTNGQGLNYLNANPPALGGGEDVDGNPTNYGVGATASKLGFIQNGATNAFITSSGAIYSFSQATSFAVSYSQATTDPVVTNVIFQTQTGGVRPDLQNILLEFQPAGGGQLQSLHPVFKALDEPLTGAFSERLTAAFQWNLTGLNVRDFIIRFAAPSSSMPLWQAQLDVANGVPFVQALGFLLELSARPGVRYGTPGSIEKNLNGGEGRFFIPGTTVHLTGEPSAGFSHVGWLYKGSITQAAGYDLTFTTGDEAIAAIFSPTNYATWRNHFFNHSNTLTQTGPDNLTESVSGPAADPDGDGRDNFFEFAYGGDPYSPDSSLTAPRAGLVQQGSDFYPSITYRRRAAPVEEMEIVYEVQVSEDLENWISNETAQSPVTQQTSAVLSEDGILTVTVIGNTPIRTQPNQYLRVKASTL